MGKKAKKKATARRIEVVANFFRDVAVVLAVELIKMAIQFWLN